MYVICSNVFEVFMRTLGWRCITALHCTTNCDCQLQLTQEDTPQCLVLHSAIYQSVIQLGMMNIHSLELCHPEMRLKYQVFTVVNWIALWVRSAFPRASIKLSIIIMHPFEHCVVGERLRSNRNTSYCYGGKLMTTSLWSDNHSTAVV